MLDDQNLIVNQFFTLWAMLDPISHLTLFLGATSELDRQERRRAAVLAVVFAFSFCSSSGWPASSCSMPWGFP